LSEGTHADVGIAAQGALLHIAVAHAGVEDDFLQAGEVLVGFVGGGNIRLTDNFNQGNAGAVQVDGGFLSGIGKALMQALARVFFEMKACDADLV